MEMLEENEELGLGEDGEDDISAGEDEVEYLSAKEDEPPKSPTPVVEGDDETSPDLEVRTTQTTPAEDQELFEDELPRKPKLRRKKGGKSSSATPRELSPIRPLKSEVKLAENLSLIDPEGSGNDVKENVDAEVDSGDVKGELSKREKRRAREAAKKARQEEVDKTPSSQEKCNICKETFTSRTKLFYHIKESGHALASPNSNDDRRQAVSKKTVKGKKR